MKIAGLDISSRALHSVELDFDGKSYIPKKYATLNLPEGTIIGGEIVNREALLKTLKDLKLANDLDFVKASLPEEKSYLYKTVVTLTDENYNGDFEDAVAFSLEENVPIPGNEVLFTWDIIDKTAQEVTLNVAAFPKKTVDEYLEILKEAGLTVVVFEIESCALAKAIVPKDSKKTFLIVEIGTLKTVFSVVANGLIQFTFIQTKANASIEKELMANVVQINEEIKKIYTYWYTRKDNSEATKKIDTIILVGRYALVPDLVEQIQMRSDLPVQLANVWTNTFSLDDYIPELPFNDSMPYGTAIGLALPK